jgi:hypothetical protein
VSGPLTWTEKGEHRAADPACWGDVILARRGIGTSYHLSVVLDDAFQQVTDVVESWVRAYPGQWTWFHRRWDMELTKKQKQKKRP